MSILTLLTLGALLVMIPCSNGIGYCAEFMVAVEDRTCSTRQTQQQAFTKHKKQPRKPSSKASTPMAKHVSSTTHTTITSAPWVMNSSQKTTHIKWTLFHWTIYQNKAINSMS